MYEHLWIDLKGPELSCRDIRLDGYKKVTGRKVCHLLTQLPNFLTPFTPSYAPTPLFMG